MEFTCKYIISLCVAFTVQAQFQTPLAREDECGQAQMQTPSSKEDECNNVTYTVKENLKEYNISKIKSDVDWFASLARDINDTEQMTLRSADFMLTAAGYAVYDTIGIGKRLCGAKSLEPMVKENADIINAAKKETFAFAPDLSRSSHSLLLLANDINNTLNDQLDMLSEEKLYQQCPQSLADKDEQEFYKCIVNQTNKFGLFFKQELDTLMSDEKEALSKSHNRWELLKAWINNVITPKVMELKQRGVTVAEKYYLNCKINESQIAEYSVSYVVANHYKSFQSAISSNVTAINELVAAISVRNYSSYTPDIRSRLEAAVAPLRTAIAAVLSSKNASTITEEVKRIPDSIVSGSVKAMDIFTANFSERALKAKQEAVQMVEARDSAHQRYTMEYLFTSCQSHQSTNAPLVYFSNCTNNLAYGIYTNANTAVLARLFDIKVSLQNMNTNFDRLFLDQGDSLVTRALDSAYTLAYKLYKAAGLRVPQDVEMYRCYYGILLPSGEFVCVVVV